MELTLSQWKERALVAEALLEERTADAEALQAELEDLRARLKEPESPDLKPGDKITVGGQEMTVVSAYSGLGKTRPAYDSSFEELKREYEAYLRGDKWGLGEMEAMTELLKAPTFTEYYGETKKTRSPLIKTHPRSPTGRFNPGPPVTAARGPSFPNAHVEQSSLGGDIRLCCEYNGTEWRVLFKFSEFRDMGPQTIARRAARGIAVGARMGRREEETLCGLFYEKLRDLR